MTTRTAAKASEEAVRAGEYAIAQAHAGLVKRVVDRRRKPAHVDNIHLWGDHIMRFFGTETPFRILTQNRVDEYTVHVSTETMKKWLGGNRKPTSADLPNPAATPGRSARSDR